MSKLLILGGVGVHCKLVEAAKELGVYTYVTDYLQASEAKLISDNAQMINIMDMDNLIELCKEECINAVLATHLDPCQRPYQTLCEKMNYYCYGTREQFFKMTDKHAFKKMCRENNVDVIPEYSIEDVMSNSVEYPLFVKPVDSRGSRGQAVCWNKAEANSAITLAKKESSNGDVLIEQYIQNAQEVQITYFFVDGEAYLIRTTDSYSGREAANLEKVVMCAVSPSRYTDQYLSSAHVNVVNMFKNMGYKNGPIFMQGFYDKGKFRFFDPGLRFPGVDYDRIYKSEFGVDLMKMMVYYSLHGKMPVKNLPNDMYRINGKRAAVLFPVIKAGVIREITGVDVVKTYPQVFSYLQRHSVGECVEWTNNVNQRIAEIDIAAADTNELKEIIADIQKNISVTDIDGQEMLFECFDTERII